MSKSKRTRNSQAKEEGAETNTKKAEEDLKVDLSELMEVKNPLEGTDSEPKIDLTMDQRMAILCINKCGGQATEEQLIEFMEINYKFLPDQTIAPNKKLLHTILFEKFNGVSMFIRSANDRKKWELNIKKSKPGMSRSVSEESFSEDTGPNFQEYIIGIIKNSELGLTFNQICEEAAENADMHGAFSHLPLERRIKAILRSKAASKEVYYDSRTMLWTCEETAKRFSDVQAQHSAYIPDELKDLEMSKITVNDLYQAMKNRGLL